MRIQRHKTSSNVIRRPQPLGAKPSRMVAPQVFKSDYLRSAIAGVEREILACDAEIAHLNDQLRTGARNWIMRTIEPERLEAKLGEAKARMLGLVNQARRLYESVITAVPISDTDNLDPNKIPAFDFAKLPDKGKRFFETYPNKRIAIANRGQYALHAYLSMKGKLEGHGFSFFVFATREDIALLTPPLNLIPTENIIPIDDYKDIVGIVAAAKERGIDGILPGYGFRSEDQQFPRLCEAAGVGFIGPNADAMTLAGDKIEFKNFMLGVGLPPIPGPMKNNRFITFKYAADDPHLEIARDWIEEEFRQGYSVLIKATGAGGGKGIRKIAPGSDFYANLAEAHSEARSFVGRGEEPLFMLERDLTSGGSRPLHIELQVVSFRPPGSVSLAQGDEDKLLAYVRNCSLQTPQRQKMVEVAVPNQVPHDQTLSMIPQEVIDEMRATVKRAAVAMNYGNAGTIEFLYDPRSGKYFTLEMNTRAQVEFLVQYLQENFDGTMFMLGAFAGYTPASMLKCSERPKQGGITGQVRITGQAGTVEKVLYPQGDGITPFTFLEERQPPLGVSKNFDKQHGAILVQAPNMLCLLHKMRVAVEKMDLIGKGVDQISVYSWDKPGILRAIDEAISLHGQFLTPDIDTVRRMEAASHDKSQGQTVTLHSGGMVTFPPRIGGLFRLAEGVCVKPGEAVCVSEAMKMQTVVCHPSEYGRVTRVRLKDGHTANTGEVIYDFVPIDEATFRADRKTRLEQLRTERLFTLAVSLAPVADRSLSEIMRRAFAGERANYNVDWIEVDSHWKAPLNYEPVSTGEGPLDGIRVFSAPEDRPEILENWPKPQWYSETQVGIRQMRKLVFVSPKEWGLKDSVLKPYADVQVPAGVEKPQARLQLFSLIQTIALHLLSGKNDLSIAMRDTILRTLSQYDHYLLGDSQDHCTPQEWVDHLQKIGRIQNATLVPVRDRALYAAVMTLPEDQGGYSVLMIAQKKVGADVNNGMNTEMGFRDIVDILARPEHEHLPVIFVANTIGADPARELDPANLTAIPYFWPVESGPDGLKRFFDTTRTAPSVRYRADDVNHGIADAVWTAVNHKAPVAAFVWNGASGGALPLLMGDGVFALEHSSNAAVIGNGPAHKLMDRELRHPVDAAEFHLQGPRGLKDFGLVDEILAEPAAPAAWGLDAGAAFENQFDRAVALFNGTFQWHDVAVRSSQTIPTNLYLARRAQFGNFGLNKGLLVEKPIEYSALPFRAPSHERDWFLGHRIESRQAQAKVILDHLRTALSGYSRVGSGDLQALLDLLDYGQPDAKTAIDYHRIFEKARTLVDRMENAATITQSLKHIIHDKAHAQRFTFQQLAENNFVCPVSGHVIRAIPPDFFLLGGLGGLVKQYSFLPKDWVDVRPGGPLDTEVYRARLKADLKWLRGGEENPFVDPLAAWVVEDTTGARFLFSMPSYFGGSHAQVTRKYSLLAQLAKIEALPWIDIAFSGGMSMYHKLGALMGMSDMIVNFSDLHREIPALQKRNPLMGHYRIIPNFPAYGGDSASSTARVSEESWRYITNPDRVTETLTAGLGIIGNPEIGFAGPKIVNEPTVKAKMIALQRGQTWIDTYFAVGLTMSGLMQCSSLSEFVARFRQAHDQAQAAYRRKYST